MSFEHRFARTQPRRKMHEVFKIDETVVLAAVIDEDAAFCRNPSQYRWSYIGNREILVPYTHSSEPSRSKDRPRSFPHDFKSVRWESKRVVIVDGRLRRGESNVLARRTFYLDHSTCNVLLGEGYDLVGKLVKSYVLCQGITTSESSKGRWYPV